MPPGGSYVIAPVKADFDLAIQLMVQKDLVALQRLADSGRVSMLRQGIAVQVMETSGFLGGAVRIRPEGVLGSGWTDSEAVRCR